ncbi:MAG: hypothetical protein D6737_02240 [Chloroflexi bacterium]|nr:MAG: hypothetical protein D6737_02240 [Chloroflexota bacterium]
MMTWTLWRALQKPPVNHPLYQHTLTASQRPTHISKWWAIPGALLVLFYGFVLFIPIPASLETAFLIISLIIPLLIVMLIFSGTGYGLSWAIGISTAVTRQRERHTYDLLSVSPAGEFGIVWAISAGRLYRSGSFNRLESYDRLGQQSQWIYIVFIMAVVFNVISNGSEIFFALIIIVIGAAALYIDYIHSALVSILIGIVTPMHTDNTLTAQLYAAGAFVLLQVITYLMAVFVWTRLIPDLTDFLHAPDGVRLTLQPLVTFAVFYATREGMIMLLWRHITQHFAITRADIDPT